MGISFIPSIQAQELPPAQLQKAVITGAQSAAENNLHTATDYFNSPLSENVKLVAAPKAVATPRVLPPFKSLRYDEDYRYLQDRDHRSDFGIPLNIFPLEVRKIGSSRSGRDAATIRVLSQSKLWERPGKPSWKQRLFAATISRAR